MRYQILFELKVLVFNFDLSFTNSINLENGSKRATMAHLFIPAANFNGKNPHKSSHRVPTFRTHTL